MSPMAEAWKREPIEKTPKAFSEIPEADSPEAKNFRSPVPYRKFKPEYTRSAYLYDVTATVEATVDLDETGKIVNVEINRWAGFGLDESVLKAINTMNWRPAERAGKPIASRFLLRYNFKKIDKDE
jgi:TonB family protein